MDRCGVATPGRGKGNCKDGEKVEDGAEKGCHAGSRPSAKSPANPLRNMCRGQSEVILGLQSEQSLSALLCFPLGQTHSFRTIAGAMAGDGFRSLTGQAYVPSAFILCVSPLRSRINWASVIG